MGDSLKNKLSQSLDSLIRKPPASGRGRGQASSGRGSPGLSGRGSSTALMGRTTFSRHPIPAPPHGRLEEKQLPKVQPQTRPHTQYQQPRQHLQLPKKRLAADDAPTRDIPLSQKLSLSLDDIASMRRHSAAEECAQYQHHQNPQHSGPRTHGIGRGVTAQGIHSDHIGAGRGSWGNSGRNSALGKGAPAPGVNTLRPSKYVLVKHNSMRGCGRGSGRTPGRGYYVSGRMERRVSDLHAHIHHSYGRGQESYEGYDDDDDYRGYEHHGDRGNGDNEVGDDFGDEEGQYSAEEEAVEEEEQQKHDNLDGAMGAADGAGSYGGQRRRQYQQQHSSATTYRQAWDFQDRLRQKIVDAQRKDLP
ncbi:hypothetical protein VaNZ11_015099, partial [Volvox africanus]